jgi:hypothetical protein
VIKDEADDIVANTPASVDVHLNNFLGKQIGVNSMGAGTINATETGGDVPAALTRTDARVWRDPELSPRLG